MKKLALFVILLMGSCGPDPILDPEGANLVAPENLNSCTTASRISSTESQVDFQWNAALYADSYEVIVNNRITKEQFNLSTNLLKGSLVLPSGAPYSWFVRSKSTLTPIITNSEIWQFYLEGTPAESYFPFPATLLFPEHESEINLNSNGSVLFQWEGNDLDNDIVSYSVYLGTDFDQLELMKEGILISQTSLDLNANTLYFWQVVTLDQSQNQSFSEIFSFQTN